MRSGRAGRFGWLWARGPVSRVRRRVGTACGLRPGLLAATILPPVIELAVLWGIGLAGDRAIAGQVTAPSPIGEFHDIRWLMTLHDSWVAVGLEIPAALLARSLLNAVVVHQAWNGPQRPPFVLIWRRTAVASLVLGIFLLPWAALTFGIDVVAISWLYIAAIPPVLFVALANPHSPVTGRWWRQAPPERAVRWILISFVGTTVLSGLTRAAPAALWVPLVVVSGIFNAFGWHRIVGSVARTLDQQPRFRPVGPGVGIGMVALAVVGTTVAFSFYSSTPPPATATPTAPHPGMPVVVVGGFDTTWRGDTKPPLPGPFDEERFSYAGLDAAGNPRPYTAADTHQSIKTSVQILATQVEAVYRKTGQRVNVVGESEGSLVARVYLAADPGAPVNRLVLLSPLDQPGRVYYPDGGAQQFGLLTNYELQALTSVLGGTSPVHLPADAPFLRSLVDHANVMRDLLWCPSQPVPEQLIEPLADALVDPKGPPASIPAVVLPAFHGGLLSDPAAQSDIRTFLEGGRPKPTSSTLSGLESALRYGGAAWQVPPLPLSLYPTKGPDQPSCRDMTAGVQAWVGLLP